MNKIVLLLTIFVLMTPGGFPAADSLAAETPGQKLVFTTPEEEGVFTKYQREVYKELSKRTGFICILKEMPKKSGIVGADKGFYDGVAARVKGIETEYPNLKMIGVSHFTVQHILFSKNPNIIETIHNIGSLIEHVMRTNSIVGFLRGSKKAKNLLSKLPDGKIFPLNSSEKGFELLQRGRIAVYLAGPGIVNRAILKERFYQSGIKEVCVISETQLFPYLNQRHLAIIPKFEKALQAMLNDGTMNRIRKLME